MTMSSNSKPLVTVVGALSKQGRSAAHSLLQSGRYRVRALTRRVDSPEAQSLAREGAKLVNVPLEVGHKNNLVNAFRGSQGVFLMTPGIAPPATHEVELGRQQAKSQEKTAETNEKRKGPFPAVPTTKVLAIGRFLAPPTPEQVKAIFPKEVPDTV